MHLTFADGFIQSIDPNLHFCHQLFSLHCQFDFYYYQSTRSIWPCVRLWKYFFSFVSFSQWGWHISFTNNCSNVNQSILMYVSHVYCISCILTAISCNKCTMDDSTIVRIQNPKLMMMIALICDWCKCTIYVLYMCVFISEPFTLIEK